MAAMATRLTDFAPDRVPSSSSSAVAAASPFPPLVEVDREANTPRHGRSPSQDAIEAAQNKRKQRHSKKLSINFPIVLSSVPRQNETPNPQYTASPTALSASTASSTAMPHPMFFSPPVLAHASHNGVPSSITIPMPLTPPSEEDSGQIVSRSRSKSRSLARHDESSAPDFFTLLASQERRVLELKEELIRAETDLLGLKKHWALIEAGKKKNEIKGIPAKTMPVTTSHTRAASVIEAGTGLGLSGIDEPVNEDKLEAERERRREMARERMLGRLTSTDIGQTANGNQKKNGQRVFSSSRHTRTLSLLTTTSTAKSEKTETSDSANSGKMSLDSARQPVVDTPTTTASPSVSSPSRTASGLEGLNLGRTYKDLANAASRKNLPPSLNPEQFVKQGKQMVDGVRDGLWNFFEDIRQATVGEEAVNGTGSGVRRQNSMKPNDSTGKPKLRRTMTDGSERSKRDSQKETDSSFWKEFGMDTPKSDKAKRGSNTKDENGNDNIEKVKDKKKQRPSLPGRWPSTAVGDELPTSITKSPTKKKTSSDNCSCPKHGQPESDPEVLTPTAELAAAVAAVAASSPTIVTKKSKTKPSLPRQDQHHAHIAKASTDSRNPPSLVSDDLLEEEEDDDDEEEEEDAWDNWDNSTNTSVLDPGSPRVVRKSTAANTNARKASGHSKEVLWHDLMT